MATTSTITQFNPSGNDAYQETFLVPLPFLNNQDEDASTSQAVVAEVWSSTALKTSMTNKRKRKRSTSRSSSGSRSVSRPKRKHHEPNIVAVQEIQAERNITLARSERLTGAAKESQALKHLQETRLIKTEGNLTDLEPQKAAHIAIAARDVLLAEERLVKAKLLEARERVEALEDDLEVAHERFLQADAQLESIMDLLRDHHIPMSPVPNLIPGLQDPLPFTIELPDVRTQELDAEEEESEQ
ncbi:hypothetical protein CVT26_000608 [Gymnopilus dilepis]|uniref:Uncharacterized protein n=1 Tax=Gymnopilus dilepis TaxID=231916 RepID=A0A409Y2C7_9AGAR|nr:hypothetical protein CVT26_000608 [Gymnopilus dilepis]